VQEGELLAGKYRIERHLGQGGMGYVVSAVHEQLHQRVAVKFLSKDHAKSPGASERFLREARAAVRIQSEHVARVLDVAELDAGEPYIVMEFLLGNDLEAELMRHGTFELTVAIDYVLQACVAVAEAHTLGLVHRDLKPANLFLTRRADGSPLVKVLDFGISKALSSDEQSGHASLTAAQSILGSPAYMSPEQARKPKSVDMRTDIWSLGVILFQFLSGDTPFTGDTPLSILAAAFVEPVPDLDALRPGLPAGIEQVVRRCLEKNPDQRFQTVAELAVALEPFADRASVPSIARIRNTIARPISSIPPRISVTPSGLVTPHHGDAASAPTALIAAPPERPTPSTLRAEPSPIAARTAESLESTTLTHGQSDGKLPRSRRLLVIAAGAGLLAIVVLWRMLVQAPKGAPGAELDATAEKRTAAPVASAPPAPPAEQTTTAALPLVEPAPVTAQAQVTAPSSSTPAPSAAAAPSAPGPRSVVVKARKPPVAIQQAVPEAEADPLDGRR
jgi:serine/threonine protein kinase